MKCNEIMIQTYRFKPVLITSLKLPRTASSSSSLARLASNPKLNNSLNSLDREFIRVIFSGDPVNYGKADIKFNKAVQYDTWWLKLLVIKVHSKYINIPGRLLLSPHPLFFAGV